MEGKLPDAERHYHGGVLPWAAVVGHHRQGVEVALLPVQQARHRNTTLRWEGRSRTPESMLHRNRGRPFAIVEVQRVAMEDVESKTKALFTDDILAYILGAMRECHYKY